MTRFAPLVAFGLAAVLPAISHASPGEKAVIADCKPGGCRCTLTATTLEEATIVLGLADVPAAAKTLITYGNNKAMWSALTPEAIDSHFGGDGRCDLEVFGPIIPKDGLWTGTVRTTKFAGCPDQVTAIVPSIVDAMLFSRNISWNQTYNPALLSQVPGQQPVAWVEAAPTVFHGTLTPPAGAAAIGVSGRLVSGLVSETSAVTTFNFTVMGCAVDAVYDFKTGG